MQNFVNLLSAAYTTNINCGAKITLFFRTTKFYANKRKFFFKKKHSHKFEKNDYLKTIKNGAK